MCASLMVDYWSLNVVLLFIKVSYTVLLELLNYPLSKYCFTFFFFCFTFDLHVLLHVYFNSLSVFHLQRAQ